MRRKYFSYWAKYNCKWIIVAQYLRWLLKFPFQDVLSAALDAGTAVGVILVYFWWICLNIEVCATNLCLSMFQFAVPAERDCWGSQYIELVRTLAHLQRSCISWCSRWGNQVFNRTADWNFIPYKTLPEGQTFGYVTFSCLIWSDLTRETQPQVTLEESTVVVLLSRHVLVTNLYM